MKDPAIIAQEINAYGRVGLWGCKKELKALADKLGSDEHIIALVRVFTGSTIGLLVATDQRLILMDHFWFWGTDPKIYTYALVAAVDYRTGIFFGGLAIEDKAGNRDDYTWIWIKDLCRFVQVTSQKIAQLHNKQNMDDFSCGNSCVSAASEIDRLWQLVEKGALSREEFDAKKKQILSQT